jgi:hypothetical protein
MDTAYPKTKKKQVKTGNLSRFDTGFFVENKIPGDCVSFENVIKGFWSRFDEIYGTKLTDEKVQD